MPWTVLERKENQTDVFYTKPMSPRDWGKYFRDLEDKRNFKDSLYKDEYDLMNKMGE